MQSIGSFVSISLVGRLGADPEVKFLPSQTAMLKLRLAVSTYDGAAKQKVSTWYSVTMFGKRGESLATMISKGDLVAVSGEFSCREYTKKDGTAGYSLDVTAHEISPLTTKKGEDKLTPRAGDKPAKPTDVYRTDKSDDDLPF